MSRLELEEIYRVSGRYIFAGINFPGKTLARKNFPRNILLSSDSPGKKFLGIF